MEDTTNISKTDALKALLPGVSLSGYKTYLVGAGMIAYGAYLIHAGDQVNGQRFISEGLGFMTLRAGISKSGLGNATGILQSVSSVLNQLNTQTPADPPAAQG